MVFCKSPMRLVTVFSFKKKFFFLKYKDSPAVCKRKPTGRLLPVKQTLESLKNVSSRDGRNKR